MYFKCGVSAITVLIYSSRRRHSRSEVGWSMEISLIRCQHVLCAQNAVQESYLTQIQMWLDFLSIKSQKSPQRAFRISQETNRNM